MRYTSQLQVSLRYVVQSERGCYGDYNGAFRAAIRATSLRGFKLQRVRGALPNETSYGEGVEHRGRESVNGARGYGCDGGYDNGDSRRVPRSEDREGDEAKQSATRRAREGSQPRVTAQDVGQTQNPARIGFVGNGLEVGGKGESTTCFDTVIEGARQPSQHGAGLRHIRRYGIGGGHTSGFERQRVLAFKIGKRPPTREDQNQAAAPQSVKDWRRLFKLLDDATSAGAEKPAQDRKEAMSGRTGYAYWKEQDDVGDREIESLEDAVGDITYAPSRSPTPIRAIMTSDKGLGRPQNWSPLTFAAYVAHLTHPARQPGTRASNKADGLVLSARHNEAVIAELVSIFTDPDLQSFVTSEALNRALLCLVRYGDFRSIRVIILTLGQRSFTFEASNFDIVLSAAADAGSVQMFVHNLRTMLKQGLQLTAHTWSALRVLASYVGMRLPANREEAGVLEEISKRGFDGLKTRSGAGSGAAPIRKFVAYR